MQMGITSREELEAWLEDKPEEWGRALALRIALRVFPLAIEPKNWKDPSKRPELALPTLRALAISTAANQTRADDKVGRAAVAARNAFSLVYAEIAERAPEADPADPAYDAPAYVIAANAAEAAHAASYPTYLKAAPHDAAATAALASDMAAAAVYNAADGAEVTVWQAITDDCRALERGASPDQLLRSDLWTSSPDWWGDAWNATRKWLSLPEGNFEIWREWYYGRVEGLPHAFADFDDKADFVFYSWIAEQPDGWWAREPAEVNADIHDFVDRLRNPSSSSLEAGYNQGAFDTEIEQLVEDPEASGSEPIPEPAAPRKKIIATMRSHEDAPAVKDQLGRQPFAKVLASRLSEHRLDKNGKRKPDEGSFFLHIDGAWGSGKSSILNMIRAELNPRFKIDNGAKKTPKPSPDDPWVIIDFNAWREQRLEPAWWALMNQLVAQAKPALPFWRKMRLILQWQRWKLWHNSSFVIILFGLLAVAISVVLQVSGAPSATELAQAATDDVQTGKPFDWGGLLIQLLGIVGGLSTIAGIWGDFLFGKGDGAKRIEELRSDPYGPVMRLFDRIISTIDRPVLVMIDDLDRCEEDYVVSLLESIQTMLRDAPISYLIAGDKRWIISSFEARYKTFSNAMADPGRGLGHLFVDKLFQLSAPLPAVQTHDLESFWSGLLMEELDDEAGSGAGDADANQSQADVSASRRAEERIAKAREHAREELEGIVDQLEIQSKIDAAADTGDAVMERAFLAEAAIQISSSESARELEHRYRPYVVLTEPNPRSLKKLVNFLALQQAMVYLEGRKVQPDLLARWCIVQMRWPQLATELAANPHWLDNRVIDKAISDEVGLDNAVDSKDASHSEPGGNRGLGSDRPLPVRWAKLLRDKDLTKVLTHRVIEGDQHMALDHKSLEQMLWPLEKISEKAAG